MKTRIAVGTGLLLTIGSAVAGSLLYGQVLPEVSSYEPVAVAAPAAERHATPEMIAQWKADAASSGYIAPRVPI